MEFLALIITIVVGFIIGYVYGRRDGRKAGVRDSMVIVDKAIKSLMEELG